jgi:hypothetical protein
VEPSADADARGHHHVEADVVVEGHHAAHADVVADKGDGVLAHREQDRRHVELEISAPPLAMHTQYPITWNTYQWRYWVNFQAKRPAQTHSHRSITHTHCQLSSRKYCARKCQRQRGFGSGVGWRSWLSIWLMFFTTRIELCVECLKHSTNPGKHSAKASPSVTLGKKSSANCTLAMASLSSTFYRALGKDFAECQKVLDKKSHRHGGW